MSASCNNHREGVHIETSISMLVQNYCRQYVLLHMHAEHRLLVLSCPRKLDQIRKQRSNAFF